jgi:hypothetical protein
MGNKTKTVLSFVGILLCLTSLFSPWWTMSASLVVTELGYLNYVGYIVHVTANPLWVEGGSRVITAINELPIKSPYLVYGQEYWFGTCTSSLIAIGSLLSGFSLGLNAKLKNRFYCLGFGLILIGIIIFPIGLDFSLNSAHFVGKQYSLFLFQDLNILSGNFGNTNFGLFSSGSGFQQEPYIITSYRGTTLSSIFFPNIPLQYMSTLSYGFFFALIGIILMAINLKRKKE